MAYVKRNLTQSKTGSSLTWFDHRKASGVFQNAAVMRHASASHDQYICAVYIAQLAACRNHRI
jgi:hypothetical protein